MAIALGRAFSVVKLTKIDDNYSKVNLDYNAGEWFIFAPHWKIGEDNLGLLNNPGIEIKGSVGYRSINNLTDVITVKSRLNQLGFNGFDRKTSIVDEKLIKAIKLFQSIIQSSTSLVGDGKIDPNGPTIRWLNAENAPQWGTLTKQGTGFISIEALETWDNHDYGCSWLDDAIVAIAKTYEERYRCGRENVSLILVNDVSLRHGGDTPDHAGHETGNAVDLRLPAKGGDLKTIVGSWQDHRYDQKAAIAMLKYINEHPLFKKAFFNDPLAIAQGLCSRAGGHDNHIHFEIKAPKML
jgi:hypothetical protein